MVSLGWVVRGRPVDFLWLLALIFCVLSLRGAFMPSQLPGFRCDDQTIKYPFYGDSISLFQLLVGLITAPAVLIFFIEIPYHWPLTTKRKWYNFRIRYRDVLSDYLVGFQLVAFLIELVKCTVTELRPHFLATCNPDWSKINCSQGVITEYSCTVQEKWLSIDIYKSFPSGHAALSFYFFVFLTVYIQQRIPKSSYTQHLIPALQAAALVTAVLCSASRIYDRRHHVWDVLFGALIGMLGGMATVRWIVPNNFHSRPKDNGGSETVTSETRNSNSIPSNPKL